MNELLSGSEEDKPIEIREKPDRFYCEESSSEATEMGKKNPAFFAADRIQISAAA